MKKISFILLSALCSYSAYAQSCVTAKQVRADYTKNPPEVTFELHWGICNQTTNLYRVWVFVDIQPVNEVTGQKNVWMSASFTGRPNVINATSSETVTGNTRGFYVTGDNGQTATIIMQINNAPAKFNWCAFATDYPPNIGEIISGSYTLRGTQSFVVSGNTIPGKRISSTSTISSLTDATGCPGCVAIKDFQLSGTNVSIDCCPNLTPVNGICRDLAAESATKIPCEGAELAVKLTEFYSTWTSNNTSGCSAGWFRPTAAQLLCMWDNREAVQLKYVDNYWSYQTGVGPLICNQAGCYSAMLAPTSYYDTSCNYNKTVHAGTIVQGCGNNVRAIKCVRK